MKLLDRANRPVVEFDPANAVHRKLYRKFLETKKWSHSPVRFDCNEEFIELPHYLNTVLIKYYMSLDPEMQLIINKPPKKPRKPKAVKSVHDNIPDLFVDPLPNSTNIDPADNTNDYEESRKDAHSGS